MTPVTVAAIGLNHPHIHDQTRAVLAAGARLVAVHAAEDDLAQDYLRAFPAARRVADALAILEDPGIELVLIASIPDQRAALAVLAMHHGKDVMIDKPAATTLAQLAELRRAQAQTQRIVSIWFSERLAVRCAARASALVAAGAIGRVVHTVGLGPHRVGDKPRPAWFYERARYGGILCDIAAHQCDQFLHYTGSTQAQVVAAHVANHAHPDRPGLEDFGELMLRGDGGSGYARVDWHTPAGLPSWGDTRLTLLGTEGSIELRKNLDIAGRPGRDHLFLVDRHGTRHIDCSAEPLPYAAQLLADVRERSETAMPQAHCFLAMELALLAQALAQPLGSGT